MSSIIDGIEPGEYVLSFAKFIQEYALKDVEEILDADDPHQHYSLIIDAQLLIEANMTLGALLLSHPGILLPLLDDAVREVQQRVLDAEAEGHSRNNHMRSQDDDLHGRKPKPLVHARVQFLPPVEEVTKPNISSIRSSDVNKLIQLSGTVIRTGMVKMLEAEREYRCMSSKCGYSFKVYSDFEQGNVIDVPKVCPGSINGRKCQSTAFEFVESSTVSCDYQEIKIQEQVQKLTVGSIPRSIIVILENDIVDSVKAGDDVVVCGILLRRWRSASKDVRCDLETIVRANSVRVTNHNKSKMMITDEMRREFQDFWEMMSHAPLLGRNNILSAVCPQIYGLFVVKIAMVLTLIGGCGLSDASGLKVRAQPHLLLIGDPGTAQLSPRSVLTTGVRTTSAGLTCTAVKDSGEWMLEAGALVLADRGLCCIDEFNSIREHDRSTIHEAMEQQTLSVAKAGLVCKLNARTTIIATTNPKGKYDLDADVSANTAIASPLLSRFDIVLVLLDTVNPAWDEVVSSFILDKTSQPAQLSQPASQGEQEVWTLAKLQAYIAWVKEEFQPSLTEEAQTILTKYYQLQRQSDHRNNARTTIRLLESLVRIAQAHARLMCRHEVLVQDAVVAVSLIEMSAATSATLGIESVLHSNFSEDPDMEYLIQEDLILRQLRLTEYSSRENGPPPSQPDDTSSRRSMTERSSDFGNLPIDSDAAQKPFGYSHPIDPVSTSFPRSQTSFYGNPNVQNNENAFPSQRLNSQRVCGLTGNQSITSTPFSASQRDGPLSSQGEPRRKRTRQEILLGARGSWHNRGPDM